MKIIVGGLKKNLSSLWIEWFACVLIELIMLGSLIGGGSDVGMLRID